MVKCRRWLRFVRPQPSSSRPHIGQKPLELVSFWNCSYQSRVKTGKSEKLLVDQRINEDWHSNTDFCLLCFGKSWKSRIRLCNFSATASASSTAMVEALRLTVAALNSSQLFFATSHMNSWTPPQKKSYCTRAPSYYSSKSSLSKSCCCLAFDSMTTSSEKRLRPFFYVHTHTPTTSTTRAT